MPKPLILLPVPTSGDAAYNQACTAPYVREIQAVGGEPMVLGQELTEAQVGEAMARAAGILLPGSPADVSPERYGHVRESATAPADPWREALDHQLLQAASERGVPVLCVCFGLQTLNVWRGGTLVQNLEGMPVNHAAGPSVATAHAIRIEEGSRMAGLAGNEGLRPMVNSSHHQAVGAVGEGLCVIARSPQDGVVEAVEGSRATLGFPVLAVQWHPERSAAISELSRGLFAWLLREARTR